MSERFYTSCALQRGPVELTGAEAHHLATVCRLRAGALVCLFNGDGHEYPARVRCVEKRSVLLDVYDRHTPTRELPFALHVAAPLPRGDRSQFLVEKLTEIGVTGYFPLATKRSVIQPSQSRREKLQRYVIEASKQCGRNVLMEVAPLADWSAYCRRDSPGVMRMLAHPGAAALTVPVSHSAAPTAPVVLAVGPEGGFTDEEVEMASKAGWQLVGLGPRILRIETAALVFAAWLSGVW